MWKYALLPMAALLIVASGCASNPGAPRENAFSEAAVITIHDSANRIIKLKEPPHHFVALGNGEMDIIYALGGNLVGRPTSSGPLVIKEAESVMQIGSTHEVDLEKITFVKPDVVFGNFPLNMKDIAPVEGTGTKMVLTAADSVNDIKKQIQLIGQLLQKEEKAEEIVRTIDAKLEEARSKHSSLKPKVLLVYGAPGTNMAALPNSLSGNLLELAGGENIAARFQSLQSFPQYATLNTERIMEANPEWILIMTHGDPEAVKESFIHDMKRNAAWSGLDAVKNNHVVILPSDLFGTNPGMRVTEAIDLLLKLFHSGANK